MDIHISYQPLAEYQRLIYTLKQIQGEFYQKYSWMLSETPVTYNNSVVVPTWDIFKNRLFWKKLQKTDDLHINIDQTRFPGLFKNIEALEQLDHNTFTNMWKEKEQVFIEVADSFLLASKTFDTVSVYLTRFGTSSSFIYRNKEAIVYLRQDASPTDLAFAIVSTIVLKHIHFPLENQNESTLYTWPERQRITDYIMQHTSLRKLFPDYQPSLSTIRSTNSVPADIVQKSDKLYDFFGYPAQRGLEITPNDILYKEKRLNLSDRERNILKVLIENSPAIVTYDQLSELMWDDSYEDYSLEAINKTIQRIRKNIKDAGLQEEVIFTKKNEGYYISK